MHGRFGIMISPIFFVECTSLCEGGPVLCHQYPDQEQDLHARGAIFCGRSKVNSGGESHRY